MAVELRKSGEKVNLKKAENKKYGEILINLNWNQEGPKKKGLFGFKKSSPIDLDLGCLFEMADGRKGVVQALGNAFGSKTQPPFIMLDKDDRSGASTDGENLFINGDFFHELKRILVYTFIYEGVPNWKDTDAVVTIKQPGAEDIVIRMGEQNSNQIMCALAYIEVNGDNVGVERLMKFYPGHKQLDEAYNWGMKWVAGSK